MSVAGSFGLTNSHDRGAAFEGAPDPDDAIAPSDRETAQPRALLSSPPHPTPHPSSALSPSLPERIAPMLWTGAANGTSFSPSTALPPVLEGMPWGFNHSRVMAPAEPAVTIGPIAMTEPAVQLEPTATIELAMQPEPTVGSEPVVNGLHQSVRVREPGVESLGTEETQGAVPEAEETAVNRFDGTGAGIDGMAAGAAVGSPKVLADPGADLDRSPIDPVADNLFETLFAHLLKDDAPPAAAESASSAQPFPAHARADRLTSAASPPAQAHPSSPSSTSVPPSPTPAAQPALDRRLPWFSGLVPSSDQYGDLWATPRTPAPLSKLGASPADTALQAQTELPQDALPQDGSIVLWVQPEEAATAPLSWQGRLRETLASDRLTRLLQVGVLVSFGTAVGSVLYGWSGDRAAQSAIEAEAALDVAQLSDPLGAVINPNLSNPNLSDPANGLLPEPIAPPETQALLSAFHQLEWNQQRAAALKHGGTTTTPDNAATGFPRSPVMVERLYYGPSYGQTYGPGLSAPYGAGGGGQPYASYPQPYGSAVPYSLGSAQLPIQPVPGIPGSAWGSPLGSGAPAPADRLYAANSPAASPSSLSGSSALPPLPLPSLAPDPRLVDPAARSLPPSSVPSPGTGSTDTATPPTPLLMGILENGTNSLALFKVNGVTQRIAPGEAVGDRGWILLAVAQGKAIVEFRGRVLALAVGQGL
ncbi:MAG: hypothetical protein ACO331_11840 [Prochlorothrix sp.]